MNHKDPSTIKALYRDIFGSRSIRELKGSMESTLFRDSYLYFDKSEFKFKVELVNTTVGYESCVVIEYKDWQENLHYPAFMLGPTSPELDRDFLTFLDAVADPRLWPLCLGIDWAQKIASRILGMS